MNSQPVDANGVIAKFGAVAGAVVVWVAAQTKSIAPPDSEGMTAFGIFCAIAGVMIGGAMYFWRQDPSFNRRWLFIAAAIAGILGAAAFFGYLVVRADRVAVIELRPGAPAIYQTVAQTLSVHGVRTVGANAEAGFPVSHCPTPDPGEAMAPQVTFSCAQAVAALLPENPSSLFDGEALRESRTLLNIWYWIAMFGFMLAIYLLVDEAISSALKTRASPPSADTTPPPADAAAPPP